MSMKILEDTYGKSMIFVAENLIKNLKNEGYLSISNSTLASIISTECKVHEAKCFLITEGFTTHFILNIDGARKLKHNLLHEQTLEHLHSPCRKPMNRIAVKQLDALMEYFEGTLCE